ncbi:MAG: phosphate regulon sensor histidine kinase PhoR [Acidiferrobacteraceae bacterium]|jgi:two-component system phosphate regulon sensor histidine kinase PhoR|nr:phosphate regulon sensor histidine kinase PhoR [Acidiferrobacterales bacterium]
MGHAIRNAVWQILAVLILALFIGFVFGKPVFAILIALLLILAFYLRNIFRLARWLESDVDAEVPGASGAWGEVFDRLYLRQKANREELAELRAMAARFEQAANAMPDAVVILGEEQEIEWINPRAERLLGIHESTDIGQPITNLVRHPGFRALLEKPYSDEEFEMRSPTVMSRYLAVRRVPYGSSQELLIARDVTQLHRLEVMRSQFVANVSHELRSPITVLSGYLETLKDAQESDPAILHKAIDTMYSQAKRMERLVTDLLALSQLETQVSLPGKTEVNVKSLLESLVEAAKILSGEGHHDIQLEVDEGLNLYGSQTELHSLFANLINNAVRYTPAGGLIKVSWKPEGKGALFAVTDTGPGIAPQHIPRLTERFYRVDVDRSRETGGTGLGLAIVKHVLDRHDGRLNIVSELGNGSTFECRFPAGRVKHVEPPE